MAHYMINSSIIHKKCKINNYTNSSICIHNFLFSYQLSIFTLIPFLWDFATVAFQNK